MIGDAFLTARPFNLWYKMKTIVVNSSCWAVFKQGSDGFLKYLLYVSKKLIHGSRIACVTWEVRTDTHGGPFQPYNLYIYEYILSLFFNQIS